MLTTMVVYLALKVNKLQCSVCLQWGEILSEEKILITHVFVFMHVYEMNDPTIVILG